PEPASLAFLGGSDVVNHRIGDLSFLAGFGRLPGSDDSEALRMKTHLVFVHERLAQRPATAPELEARRAELLTYLDDYIALARTPENTALPFRNPVFLDHTGAICAVGYLIERSAGRALAETVASAFRHARLENIVLPELLEWVRDSGFTLDELASIQPAYSPPPLDSAWVTWVGPVASDQRAPDGPWRMTDDAGAVTTGAWKKGKLVGEWRRVSARGNVIGRGTFVRGRGGWTGLYDDGTTAAEGRYANNAPVGLWKIFYPSGRLAAAGAFRDGLRWGRWTFYHDVPALKRLATGVYRGYEAGTWEHHDAKGRRVASVWPTTEQRPGFAITWYDADGAVTSTAAVQNEHEHARYTVLWYPDGRPRAITFDEYVPAVAYFYPSGRLRAMRTTLPEAPDAPLGVATSRKRVQLERLASSARDRRRRGRFGGKFFRRLAKLLDQGLEQFGFNGDFDAQGRPLNRGKLAAHESELRAADSALGEIAFATTSAPTLYPACPAANSTEPSGLWPAFCRADDAETAAPTDTLRWLLRQRDTMVTAGFNYPHLDRIFDRAYATLVDKARLSTPEGAAPPGHFARPFQPFSNTLENEYSWTSWGPVLRRHGVRLKDVF
ncbi:MAG: hypothetical protein ACI9MR_004132, partial [Myxococcota bacterium]